MKYVHSYTEGFDNKVTITDVLGRIIYKTASLPKQRYEFGNKFHCRNIQRTGCTRQ